MPTIINPIFTKDFPDLGRDVLDTDLVVIAIPGNQITYKTTVGALKAAIIGVNVSGTSDSSGNFDASSFNPPSVALAWSAFDSTTDDNIPVSYNNDTKILSGFGASQSFYGKIG